jgi:Protein of unknown function (DUF935)
MTDQSRILPWYRRLFGSSKQPEVLEGVLEPPSTALALARDGAYLVGGSKPETGAAVEQGQVSSYRDWTPDLLRLAEIQADRGDLSLAADLCDALLTDPVIASKLRERVRAVVGADVKFEPGQGRSKGRAVKALEAGEDFWALLPDAEYSQLLSWGLLLGVGLGQHKGWAPRPSHGGRLLPDGLDVWHPRDLRRDVFRKAWEVRVEGGGVVPVVAGDGQWILFTPFGKERPSNFGLWRQLARFWLLKRLSIGEWQRANQTNGARVITANLPVDSSGQLDDYNDSYRRRLVQELRQMGRSGVVALKPGLDLKLLEMSSDSWESFSRQCDLCDGAAAVAIVGSSLSTVGDKASYASSQTGAQVSQDIRRADASIEQSILHDQVMAPWAIYNFGDVGAAPWPLRQVDSPPDATSLNAELRGFGEAVQVNRDAGVEIDVAAIAKSRGIQLKEGATNQAPILEWHVKLGVFSVDEVRARYGYGPLRPEATATNLSLPEPGKDQP